MNKITAFNFVAKNIVKVCRYNRCGDKLIAAVIFNHVFKVVCAVYYVKFAVFFVCPIPDNARLFGVNRTACGVECYRKFSARKSTARDFNVLNNRRKGVDIHRVGINLFAAAVAVAEHNACTDIFFVQIRADGKCFAVRTRNFGKFAVFLVGIFPRKFCVFRLFKTLCKFILYGKFAPCLRFALNGNACKLGRTFQNAEHNQNFVAVADISQCFKVESFKNVCNFGVRCNVAFVNLDIRKKFLIKIETGSVSSHLACRSHMIRLNVF